MWVKCQDAIQGGKQPYNHIAVLSLAESLGWYPRDLFVFVFTGGIPLRHRRQIHATKNHSYLWVFET